MSPLPLPTPEWIWIGATAPDEPAMVDEPPAGDDPPRTRATASSSPQCRGADAMAGAASPDDPDLVAAVRLPQALPEHAIAQRQARCEPLPLPSRALVALAATHVHLRARPHPLAVLEPPAPLRVPCSSEPRHGSAPPLPRHRPLPNSTTSPRSCSVPSLGSPSHQHLRASRARAPWPTSARSPPPLPRRPAWPRTLVAASASDRASPNPPAPRVAAPCC
nr:pistil-specific extensin-like protein [Aegilops tauschii subsp. strangulata]